MVPRIWRLYNIESWLLIGYVHDMRTSELTRDIAKGTHADEAKTVYMNVLQWDDQILYHWKILDATKKLKRCYRFQKHASPRSNTKCCYMHNSGPSSLAYIFIECFKVTWFILVTYVISLQQIGTQKHNLPKDTPSNHYSHLPN